MLSCDYHSSEIFRSDAKRPRIDDFEKSLYSTDCSLEALPLNGNALDIECRDTKKVQNHLSSNQENHPPITQRVSTRKVVEQSIPSGSQKSSPSTRSTTSSSPSRRKNARASSSSNTLRIPRLWTPKEDKLLLNSITLMNNRLHWPKIAVDIPGRTGKQCRERYLNHLGPHLKHTGWSAHEDATIFRLYASQGSKWSRIVKFLPGRTDNGIKNRFHHLRRRFEKRMKCVPDSKELTMLMKKMEECSSFRSLSPDPFDTRDIAVRILAESSSTATKMQDSITGDGEYKFGPFDQMSESVECGRCGLIVPSKETGTMMCRKTGWCENCTGVSLVISGELLRAIHFVRERSLE